MGLHMKHTLRRRLVLLSAATALTAAVSAQEKPPLKLDPSAMTKLGDVDPRYLSFNIEMVEVTGGRFWKPYGAAAVDGTGATANGSNQPGMSADLFQYRPPIDLHNARLRKLAAALGPSFVRVSGTWANSTFFRDNDQAGATHPPDGYKAVLNRAEWKGVIDFARVADAQIVTSVAISSGARNGQGVWTPGQAKALFDFTRESGGFIAASEFMNEPNIPGPGSAPSGYDAAAYGRDAKLFETFLRTESPQTTFLGPGSVGEGASLMPPGGGMQLAMIKSEDLLKAAGPIYDAFSYHFYGAVSHRCGGKMTIDQALSSEWLDRTDTVQEYYATLRDHYLPAKPMWLTETAEAACGGDPFAGQFADAFRFLNQLGTLAQKGVKVVMHNTLAASDYGLLTSDNFEPRPDYWAAVLWKRAMGATVLAPNASSNSTVRIYAHCSKLDAGGVTLLALNTSTNESSELSLPLPAERYTLTGEALSSTIVSLNGIPMQAAADGSLQPMKPQHAAAGTIRVAPESITFLEVPAARNRNCSRAGELSGAH